MKNMTQGEIVKKMSILLGKKNPSSIETYRSVMSYLSQIKSGERCLPEKWKPFLLNMLECNIDELRKAWPRMRLKGEKGITSRNIKSSDMKLNVKIIIEKTEATISKKSDLPELLFAIKELNSMGFLLEIKIQPTEE